MPLSKSRARHTENYLYKSMMVNQKKINKMKSQVVKESLIFGDLKRLQLPEITKTKVA